MAHSTPVGHSWLRLACDVAVISGTEPACDVAVISGTEPARLTFSVISGRNPFLLLDVSKFAFQRTHKVESPPAADGPAGEESQNRIPA